MISKNDRQKIVDEFSSRNHGWDARMFRDEVRDAGEDHPAWTWFTWEESDAADAWQVQEAMKFVHGLRIRYSLEIVERGVKRIRVVESPHVFSPLTTRRTGGGYVILDPEDPKIMTDFLDEARAALEAWLFRYNGALVYAKGSTNAIEKQIAILTEAVPDADAA